uniref:Galactokinase 2 n=1 Tax=Laticauda laticaudata TaxID=8630 RepID=A0A8C5WS74_LATLA
VAARPFHFKYQMEKGVFGCYVRSFNFLVFCLIGEHIDYCGYSVLPMAIDQDILIAAEPLNNPILHLANTDPSYSDFNTDANDIQIKQTKPLWHNYFLCGFKGIQDRFNLRKPSGINCLVEGTIPPSSGLSSSSALVCCAALVTLVANAKTLSKVELANLCSKSERYIGTEGGGMDQSICFLAEKGTAKLIEFNPLKATNVKLPGGAVFVIANSCVEMNKAATSHFNIRVMECRLATKVLYGFHQTLMKPSPKYVLAGTPFHSTSCCFILTPGQVLPQRACLSLRESGLQPYIHDGWKSGWNSALLESRLVKKDQPGKKGTKEGRKGLSS